MELFLYLAGAYISYKILTAMLGLLFPRHSGKNLLKENLIAHGIDKNLLTEGFLTEVNDTIYTQAEFGSKIQKINFHTYYVDKVEWIAEEIYKEIYLSEDASKIDWLIFILKKHNIST